jgi:hypothetical protein
MQNVAVGRKSRLIVPGETANVKSALPVCLSADRRSPEAEAIGEGTRPKPMASAEALAACAKASAPEHESGPLCFAR